MLIAKTVKESLRMLWKEGFFKELSKIYMGIDNRLHKASYHFEQRILSHILANIEFLTKEIKDSKVHIKKYPYSEEKKNG